MKSFNSLLIAVSALIILSISSCHVYNMGRTPATYQPYVQLKTGRIISLDSAQVAEHGVNLKHPLNDSILVRKKDVAFYSDGYYTFANVGRKEFAAMTDEGRINVFTQYKRHYKSNGSSTLRVRHFVQDSGALSIYPAKYRHLKLMIPTGTPARAELDRFHRNRWLGAIPMIVGLTGMVAGMNAAGNDNFEAGAGLLFGGMGLMVATPIIWNIQLGRKWKAIGVHNGVERP